MPGQDAYTVADMADAAFKGFDMSTAFFQLFQKGYIINLPERVDRRDDICAELRSCGQTLESSGLEFFDAIKPFDKGDFPSIGARGCFLSHLHVLRAARDADLDAVLILEDDAHFGKAFQMGAATMPAVLDTVDWDLFYAGYAIPSGAPQPQGETLELRAPTDALLTSHAMIFRRSAIDAAILFLEALLTRPAGSAEGGPMHVDGAYNWLRRAHPELKTVVSVPALITQRASRSDINAGPAWIEDIPFIRFMRRVKNALR